MPELPAIQEIAEFLEAWAPPASAQSYDNVGLQVGDPSVKVKRGLIALDVTPQVLEEATTIGATLIVSHHPLIFHPLRSVTTESFASSLAFGLAASGVALYSIHTNLDAASGGVSFALGQTLGLSDLAFLDTLAVNSDEVGLGVIGVVHPPLSLNAFLERASERLDAKSMRYVGDPEQLVERAAVCGGAGSDLIGQALASRADAYLTADLKYHQFFEVLDTSGHAQMALIDAGHYETEAMTERLLLEELAAHFPRVDWRRTEHRTSPISTYVRE